MPVKRESRWMPAWLALIRTYTRMWEQVEARMRRDTGLTMPRYDVCVMDQIGASIRGRAAEQTGG